VVTLVPGHFGTWSLWSLAGLGCRILAAGWVSRVMVRFTVLFAFSALTLLVGQQEGHAACKKTEWWDVGVVVWDEVQTCI